MRNEVSKFLNGGDDKPSFPLPIPQGMKPMGPPEMAHIRFHNFDELVNGIATLTLEIAKKNGVPVADVIPTITEAIGQGGVPPRVHIAVFVELARRELKAEEAGAPRDKGGVLEDTVEWVKMLERGEATACVCMHCMMRSATRHVAFEGKTFDEAMALTLAFFKPRVEAQFEQSKKAFESIFTRTNDETVKPREQGNPAKINAGFVKLDDGQGPMKVPPPEPPSLEGQ